MLKKLTVGKKLGVGIALILSLTFVVGIVGYIALNSVMDGITLYKDIYNIQSISSDVRLYTDQYRFHSHEEGREAQNAAKDKVLLYLNNCLKAITSIDGELVNIADFRQKLGQAEDDVENYKKSFNDYVRSEMKKISLEKSIKDMGTTMTQSVSAGEFLIEEMQTRNEILLNETSVYFFKNVDSHWQKLETALDRMKKAVEEWSASIESSDTLRPMGDKIKAQLSAYKDLAHEYHTEVMNQSESELLMKKYKENLSAISSELYDKTLAKMREIERFSLITIFGFMIVSLLAGSLFPIYLTRKRIVQPILRLRAAATKLANGGAVPAN